MNRKETSAGEGIPESTDKIEKDSQIVNNLSENINILAKSHIHDTIIKKKLTFFFCLP